MFKKGFSTAEILIVLVIVGVISVAMFTIIRPNDKVYGKLAYKAYNILSTATYNINEDARVHNENLYNQAIASGSSVNEDELREFPKDITDFCNKLAALDEGYINTSYTNCSNILSSSTDFVDDNGKVIANPTFIASNGMKFYLFEKDWTLEAYFMFVDINGAKKPNNVNSAESKKTDMIPFLISMTDGTILPAGIAQYDGTYLIGKVIYSNPNLQKGDSAPMNIKSAMNSAFGANVNWTQDLKSFSGTGSGASGNDKLLSLIGIQQISNLDSYSVSNTLDPNCSHNGYNLEKDYPPCTIKIVEDN